MFQVYPKDIGALPVHPEPAVSWHSGFPGGDPMLDVGRRQFITRRGGWPPVARAGAQQYPGPLCGSNASGRGVQQLRSRL